MRNIIADQPFVDGNKRTGVIVCGIFLRRNGSELAASPAELEDFAVQVATELRPSMILPSGLKTAASDFRVYYLAICNMF